MAEKVRLFKPNHHTLLTKTTVPLILVGVGKRGRGRIVFLRYGDDFRFEFGEPLVLLPQFFETLPLFLQPLDVTLLQLSALLLFVRDPLGVTLLQPSGLFLDFDGSTQS